jgi:OmpA-OmpF porin, OOP family
MKRYADSQIIGYRAPKFDEFLLPLGAPTQLDPPAYAKSQKVEGLVSRYTYIAPADRTPAEVFRNYKLEFKRLNIITLFEKGPDVRGWFGPTLQHSADEDGIGQILGYNEAQERVLVGKSKDPQPVWYYAFFTAYKDGVIPERLRNVVTKDRTLVYLVVVAPEKLEERMEFVTAAQMASSLADTGKVALYGIHFDTDKDTIRPDSKATLDEIGRLLS